MCSLSNWPPQYTSEQEAQLLEDACAWSLGHGLAFKPTSLESTQVVHGPFALYPTAFPRSCFNQAQALQTAYNALYARIASDQDFLDKVVGGTVAKVDAFQGGLYSIWKQVRTQGIKQDLVLGLFRSDYLLHGTSETKELCIKQVEFNTISSSFGPLASKVSDLHRYLASNLSYPSLNGKVALENLPRNPALVELASGLAEAHRAYNQPESVYSPNESAFSKPRLSVYASRAVVLMVVQDNERNIYDQRALEWELLEVLVICSPFQKFFRLTIITTDTAPD